MTSTVRELKICVQQKWFNEDKERQRKSKKGQNRQSPWDKERINSTVSDKLTKSKKIG
jgi:hypothetical protein